MAATATLGGVSLGMIAPLQRHPKIFANEVEMVSGHNAVMVSPYPAWSITIQGQLEEWSNVAALISLIGVRCRFIYEGSHETFNHDGFYIVSWDRLTEVDGNPGVYDYQITLAQDNRPVED